MRRCKSFFACSASLSKLVPATAGDVGDKELVLELGLGGALGLGLLFATNGLEGSGVHSLFRGADGVDACFFLASLSASALGLHALLCPFSSSM